MHLDDQEKTIFVSEWGVFVAVVMMFKIFDDYIPAFMQVFLDDLAAVYGRLIEHLPHLHLCLERCPQAQQILNPAKCAFYVSSGTLLWHIVGREGIVMVPEKVQAILNASAPTTAKALNRFLGQIR